MSTTSTPAKIVSATDGKSGNLGAIGVRFMLDAVETGGAFTLVEHPIPARTLAAPLHRHSREDEYSYVLSGRMGALLGDDVVEAQTGDLVVKPRGQWHTFWNAGDEECRVLEIISPGGFEGYFDALVENAGPPSPELVAELEARYGIDHDIAAVPGICARFGLRFPGIA